MSRHLALVFAALTLALAALLSSGMLAALSPGIRLTLAFATLILLPGHALLALTGSRPPGGPWLSSGWALGLGVAWTGALVLLLRAFGAPFTLLAPWGAAPAALLWVVVAARPERGADGDSPSLGGIALGAVALAAVLAAVHCARLGTPLSVYSDSPDHIATIRRMLASGDAFPADAFFRDAGAAGVDPRKGLWHAGVALISKLAGADPLIAWQLLPALLAPLFVLNAAAFAWLIGGPAAAAVGAWALLLTYGTSLASPVLREAAFATKLADQLALATFAAVIADVERPGRGARLAAIGLALGAIAAHVFAALEFGVAFAAFGVGLLARERRFGGRVRRLTATALAIGAAALPYLLWRARASYAPVNVIHLEPQGLMTLWPGAVIVMPGMLWDWMGVMWVLIPLSWWAWARASARPAVLFLLTTTLAVFALLFLPPLVAVLQPKLGYLLMRFVWLVPLSAAFAFALPSLVRAVRDRRGAARWRAALGLAGVALLLKPAVLDAALVFRSPHWVSVPEAGASITGWSDALAWMDRRLPEGTVVLSDPATSYSVPMMTRHHVATLVDQHSSPNDPHALERILDARDALDPYGTWARTREVIERYGVTAIALNDRFPAPLRLDYWAPDPEWYAAARARFDAQPEAFSKAFDVAGFVVYEVRRAALDTLGAPAVPRPFVRPWDPANEREAAGSDATMPAVQAFRLERERAAPGDTLHGTIEWRAARALAPGAYRVAVRFDRDLPGGFTPPAWCAKPARKLIEIARHERYRFRVDHLPAHGAYGVDLWRPSEVVRDSFSFEVPAYAADGDYRVQVRMLRPPHYANYRLSDYFFDTDYYSGAPVGRLGIERPAAPTRGH